MSQEYGEYYCCSLEAFRLDQHESLAYAYNSNGLIQPHQERPCTFPKNTNRITIQETQQFGKQNQSCSFTPTTTKSDYSRDDNKTRESKNVSGLATELTSIN